MNYWADLTPKEKELLASAASNHFTLVGDDLKDDGRFMLAAIRIDPTSIRYASDRLKNETIFMSAAVITDPAFIRYASDRLKKDRDFILRALENLPPFFLGQPSAIDLKEIMNSASVELKDDPTFMLNAISRFSSCLRYASDRLRNDKTFFISVLPTYSGYALWDVPESLQKDKEAVLAAVRKDGMNLVAADDKLKDDEEVVLAAVGQNVTAMAYASERLKRDQNFQAKVDRIQQLQRHVASFTDI